MSRSPLFLSSLMVLSLLGLPCGGQNATPSGEGQATDATPAPDTPSETFAPETIDPGEPVPPLFDPALTESAASDAQIPGPLAQGIYEAPGLAHVLVAVVGSADPPTELRGDIAVVMHLESQRSARGHELLAHLRTPAPKAEGGFLYFTASTGGGGGVAPVESSFVRAQEGTDGAWHYGVDQAPTPVGLLNLTDLVTGIANLPADLPAELQVDQFEAVLNAAGTGFALTAAGTLPDGRRLIVTATASGPLEVQAAIAGTAGTDNAPPASDPSVDAGSE